MSLKTFHVVFISASTLLAFGFGGWLLKAYAGTGQAAELIFGITSIAVGIGLIAYGRYFLKKLKHIGYL